MNKIIHDEYLHGNIVCIRPKTGYLFWKWANEYVLVPRLTLAWTGTRTRLYALTWAWSAQPGRRVNQYLGDTTPHLVHKRCSNSLNLLEKKSVHLSKNVLQTKFFICYTMYTNKLKRTLKYLHIRYDHFHYWSLAVVVWSIYKNDKWYFVRSVCRLVTFYVS